MHRPLSALPLLSLLVTLLACAPLQVFAVPWTSQDNSPFNQPHSYQPTRESTSRFRSVFPQLIWLRDTVIESVFSLPPRPTKSYKDNLSTSHRGPSNTPLPASLLAKYGGDVVLRFNITSSDEEAALSEAADTLFLDVWAFADSWADIRLREDDVPSLLGLLPKSLQASYSPLMPDLARSIYQSYPSATFQENPFPPSHGHRAFTPTLRASGDADNIFFRDYQPLSVIVPWMRLMASMFTTHVRMINIGISYEGRDIPALRVGVHPTNNQKVIPERKTIIVSGGSHAREWISVSTVTYIAWSLITSYGKSPAITKLLQEFDWVFIPTLNVDGYVYTWENDRLWRKNRQQTNLRFCQGLDLDRGFGFEWDGTSFQSNPCSESYPGNEPFQAVESHRFAEWAKNETDNNNVKFVGFLDLHSYSQQVLYPYSYSCAAIPPSIENLEELGIGLAKAIRISSGESYSVSSACEGSITAAKKGKNDVKARMETGGGSAIDWFYHEMKVRYSYQIKLRDTGSYGFLLPSEHILPTGEEAFNAVKYFGDFLLGNKGIEGLTAEENVIATDRVSKDAAELKVDIGEEIATQGEEDKFVDDMEDIDWELRRRKR